MGPPKTTNDICHPFNSRRLQIDFENSAEVVLGDETLLPDYLPSALFSDLNLPELTIELLIVQFRNANLQGLKAFTWEGVKAVR